MERSKLIDTLKGLGIVFVILGNISLTPTVLKVWLYSFHMPLFFICSGLVFSINRYSDFKVFLNAKVRSIAIPYFTLGMSLWFLKNLLNLAKQIYSGSIITDWNLGKTALSLVLGYRLHNYYFSLWFLCVLFFSELLLYFLENRVQKTAIWKRGLIYLLISIAGIAGQWFIIKYVKGWFLSLDLVPTGLAFLSLGRLFRLINDNCRFSFRQVWLLPIAFSGSILTCMLNYHNAGKTDLYYSNIGNPVLFFLAAVMGSWFIIILLTQLCELKVAEYLGKNSLIIYVFQNSFSIPAAKIINNYLKGHFSLFSDKIMQWLMIYFITLIISVALVEVINRFFPWMLGKNRIIKQV